MRADLILAAKKAVANAYAPYSVYQVGAAVLGSDGKIYSGCNVENVSFGLSLCAERSAIAQMVANGCTSVKSVAVVTRDGGTPCGMCRQVLAEFASEDCDVICIDSEGRESDYRMSDLLPSRFATAGLKKD